MSSVARKRNLGHTALVTREQEVAAVRAQVRSEERARAARAARDTGHGTGLMDLIREPTALFCVSLFCFLVVCGIKLYENGIIYTLFGAQGAPPIEDGPIRFAPHTRKPAPAYRFAPGASPARSTAAPVPEETPEPDPALLKQD